MGSPLRLLCCGAAVAAAEWRNITVYHVNEHAYGPVPVNMDTGDAAGDWFFDMEEVIIVPLVCDNDPTGHGCANQEAVGPDLVVNKLVLAVEAPFERYAKCNVGVNGTDGHGHACEDGVYCCYCEGDTYDDVAYCGRNPGRENLTEHYSLAYGCDDKASAADCYKSNLIKKLTPENPGFWYSTLKEDYCGGDGGCTWRDVSVEKIVSRRCHLDVFGATVQATAPDCLVDNCGDQSHNTSSPCWVDCFYQAALGPDSGHAGGAVAGMSLDDLLAAWEKPFLPVDEGGCPPLPGRGETR